ncbi:MAG TPA: PIN domain-containing protein [Planctomycetaceae bacterium]|nr:PIN domain-containing protein [Planctomycetaceae bacterium]
MILDTNALSAFVDGEPAVGAWAAAEPRVAIPVIVPTTRVYADVRRALKRAGHPIPANDVWIAALALQYGQSVLSRNEHFDAVPGLRRESW